LLRIDGYRRNQPAGTEENNLHTSINRFKVQATRNKEETVLNPGQQKVDKSAPCSK
jgi:hypothetical protein